MKEQFSDLCVALTPLYGFSSDYDEMVLNPLFTLKKYDPTTLSGFSPEDILVKHVRLYTPDYILMQHPIPKRQEEEGLRTLHPSLSDDVQNSDLFLFSLQAFYFPATNLFRLLRLFKPQRLVAGDTFVIEKRSMDGKIFFQTSVGRRCSENSIDYTSLAVNKGLYQLTSEDVPFFASFSERLLPQLEALQTLGYLNAPPPLEIALFLYNQDDWFANVSVLNCLTALEALLTNDSNAELSYRLSLRVANLLGADDADRLTKFKEMKEFYDLRSKIVHGSSSKLSVRLQNRLQLADSLREIVRRVILSIMALSPSAETIDGRLEDLWDQLVFDEARRREVQGLAARFLHIGTPAQFVQ